MQEFEEVEEGLPLKLSEVMLQQRFKVRRINAANALR